MRKTKSPDIHNKLRKKLYPIKFSDEILFVKKRVDWEKVSRLAKEVKETFKNENSTHSLSSS